MFDRRTFFAYARRAPFGGRLSSAQVDGLTRILDEWDASHLTDVRWLAYMLATAFHETGAALQPIRERGGEGYLRSKPYYPWVGEGLVQVTWERNHRLFGARRPGELLTWEKVLPALFRGMEEGLFTGRRLADFFSAVKDDPVGARRIVNGTDKARLIAGYHRNFLDALMAADKAVPQQVDVAPDATRPDDVRSSGSPVAPTTGRLFAAGAAALPVLETWYGSHVYLHFPYWFAGDTRRAYIRPTYALRVGRFRTEYAEPARWGCDIERTLTCEVFYHRMRELIGQIEKIFGNPVRDLAVNRMHARLGPPRGCCS